MTPFDLAVGEAGLAGLIVAALAARNGQSVAVIGRAEPAELLLQADRQAVSADLNPQIWPAGVLERLVERLDLRLTIDRPALPLQLQTADGRCFDDWQDAAQRAYTRRRWLEHPAAAVFWQQVEQSATLLRRQIGGSGGIVNAVQLWQQGAQSPADLLRDPVLQSTSFRAVIELFCQLGEPPVELTGRWPAAADAIAAGGAERAVIVGGSAALTAALRDALLRDGALVLPRARLQHVRSAGSAVALELRDGTQISAAHLVIDGGRQTLPCVSLSAVLHGAVSRDEPVMRVWAGQHGDAVYWGLHSGGRAGRPGSVTVQRRLDAATVTSVRHPERTVRQEVRNRLKLELEHELARHWPTAEVTSARQAILAAPRRRQYPAHPAVSAVLRSNLLSPRFGAGLIEGIGTARRLGIA